MTIQDNFKPGKTGKKLDIHSELTTNKDVVMKYFIIFKLDMYMNGND